MLKARMCPGSPHAMFKKALIGLQRYKQTKVNPHWWVNSKIERTLSWITSGSFFDFQNSLIPNYLAQCNPCIPFRLFKATLQRIFLYCSPFFKFLV